MVIIGIMLTFFIPGYLLINLMMRKLQVREKIALGFGLSVSMNVLIAFILGINDIAKAITGGITKFNIFAVLIVLSIIFAVLNLMKYQLIQKWIS
jgi:uncharacterized membrane protein